MVGLAVGMVVGSAGVAWTQVRADVNTNGVLVGYEVQANGRTICSNPTVYKQFRGPTRRANYQPEFRNYAACNSSPAFLVGRISYHQGEGGDTDTYEQNCSKAWG